MASGRIILQPVERVSIPPSHRVNLYTRYQFLIPRMPSSVHVLIPLGFFASLIKPRRDVFLAREPNGNAYVKCPPYWLADWLNGADVRITVNFVTLLPLIFFHRHVYGFTVVQLYLFLSIRYKKPEPISNGIYRASGVAALVHYSFNLQ